MKRILLAALAAIAAVAMQPALAQTTSAQTAKPISGSISGGIARGTFGLVGEAVVEMIRREYPGSSIIYDQGSSAGTLSRLMQNDIKVGFSFSEAEITAAKNGWPPFKEKLSDDGVLFVARVADGMQLFALSTKEFVDKYGIKTFGDIKTKKVPVRISLHRAEVPAVSAQVNELMRAYGITEADIKSWGGEVFHEATEGYTRLMQNRRLDVAFSTTWHPTSSITELQVTRELAMIPIDREVIDRIAKTFGTETSVTPKGTYSFLTEDYYTTSLSFPILARADAGDDLIYGIVKSINNQFDYYRSVHPLFAQYTTAMLPKAGTMPIHPAALKFYREAGLVK